MPEFIGGVVVSGADPLAHYSRSPLDAAKEIGRQFIGSTVVDVPRMAGQGLRWLNNDEGAGGRLGQSLVAGADERAPGYEPNNVGAGIVGETFSKGARAVGPMLPALAAGMIPGVGQAAGLAAMGAMFGPSSAQDTSDKIKLAGGSDEDARTAGYLSGTIQAGGEMVAGHFALGALRAGKAAFGAAGPTMEGVVNAATNGAVLKPAAKAIGLNMLVEPATEAAQDVGTELVERAYGAQPENLLGIAKDSAQGAIGLTALLSPLMLGARMSHAKRARAVDAALNDPSAPAEARQMAEQIVTSQAAEAGVAPEQIQAWRDQRAAPTQLAPPSAPTQLAAPSFQGAAAEPGAGVDPQVAQAQQAQAVAAQTQQQAAQEEQSRVDAVKQKIVATQAARADAENQLGGTELDEKGKRTVKVPGRYVDTYLALQDAADMGHIDEAAFRTEKENLIAALQTNDNKTMNEVRKRLDETLNPKPEPEVKPAVAPKPEAAPAAVSETKTEAPAPAPAAPAKAEKPAEAKVVAPAPVEAAVEAPVEKAVVDPKIAAPVEAKALATPAAPVELPHAGDAANYARYAGRAVEVRVPHPKQEGKFVARTVKDAQAALHEADDRASKFEELVKCLT